MSFDAIAPWYRTLEGIAFGDDLQRCRVACLDEVANPRRVLIVGEGNGRFLGELLRAHPEVEVDCVDASAGMLELARKRLALAWPDRLRNVRFLQRDLTTWQPPERHYDLLVTHFFLDCFPETQLADIVEKLAAAATDEARWLLADFRVPAKGIARLRARIWLAVMYRFFRMTAGIGAMKLVDPTPFLQGKGFILARRYLFRRGMLKSEVWRRSL